VWVKPYATKADFDKWRAYCASKAELGILPISAATSRFDDCMRGEGWIQIPRDAKFTWVRADGTAVPREEVEAAKKECEESARDSPSSPLYGPNIMQCIQSHGYRWIEESAK
jgi:hypothetical protein